MVKVFLLVLLLFSLISGSTQDQTMGLFLNSPDSYNGYTLLSNNEKTYLIDNCGFVVNTWESQYKAGHGLYLLDNGSLIRAGYKPGHFNAGGTGGVFELFDWGGELIWSYTLSTATQTSHHDLAVLPNGNFLCIVWEKKSEAEAQENGRKFDGEVWSEKILEIKMVGSDEAEIVWEWSVWDHLIQDYDPTKENYGVITDHPELIDLNYIGEGHPSSGNWLHFNAIDYNPILDQIVVSSRNLSEIYVIDHSTTIEEAAGHSGGKSGKGGDFLYRYGNPQVYKFGNESDQTLFHQHDIRWVPSNHQFENAFSVFNNEYIMGSQSSVMVFENPADENGNYEFVPGEGYGKDSIVYNFSTPDLYSDILSSVQFLPNGNILILEGRNGHIFEINNEEEIVWDYIFPVNRNGGPGIQSGQPQFNTLFRADRYGSDFIGFADKDLDPTEPIELLPIDVGCTIYSSTSITYPPEKPISPNILGNPILDEFVIQNLNAAIDTYIIYDIMGSKMVEGKLKPGINYIDASKLNFGIYLIQFSADGHLVEVKRVVKL